MGDVIAPLLWLFLLSAHPELEQLRAPHATTRYTAAVALKGRLTAVEAKWLRRVSPRAFYELLDVYPELCWGERDLRAVDMLLRGPFVGDVDRTTANAWVLDRYRSEWFHDWSWPRDLVWEGWAFIASRPWLRTLFLESPRARPEQRRVVRALAGLPPPVHPVTLLPESEPAWVTVLRSGSPPAGPFKGGRGNDEGLANFYHSDLFGPIPYAELICLLRNRPDWVEGVQEQLRTSEVWVMMPTLNGWKAVQTFKDVSSTTVRLASLSALGKVRTAAWEFEQSGVVILPERFLGHSWFDGLTADGAFQRWYAGAFRPAVWTKKDRINLDCNTWMR